MARSGMAGRAHGLGQTGEKRPGTAGAVGGQAMHTGVTCNLCAVLGRNGPVNGRYSSSGTDHGLRIALVDDDEETRLEARRMVRTERDDWALESLSPVVPKRAGRGSRPR